MWLGKFSPPPSCWAATKCRQPRHQHLFNTYLFGAYTDCRSVQAAKISNTYIEFGEYDCRICLYHFPLNLSYKSCNKVTVETIRPNLCMNTSIQYLCMIPLYKISCLYHSLTTGWPTDQQRDETNDTTEETNDRTRPMTGLRPTTDEEDSLSYNKSTQQLHLKGTSIEYAVLIPNS